MTVPAHVQQLAEVLLGGSGHSNRELRRAVFGRCRGAQWSGSQVPDELRALVEKTDEQPWAVETPDLARLRDAGFTEDEIFELTLAAATGAGMRRWDAALRALQAANADPAVRSGER